MEPQSFHSIYSLCSINWFHVGPPKNAISFQVEESGNNSPGNKRAGACPDWPFRCLLACAGAPKALLLSIATMVVNTLTFTSPLAPKLGTEPRTLNSDVTLLPFNFFLPRAFSHIPPAIWKLFYHSPFYFLFFQSQRLPPDPLPCPSPELAVLFLYGFFLFFFVFFPKRERVRRDRRRGRESYAGSMPSMEPDVGLSLMSLRS